MKAYRFSIWNRIQLLIFLFLALNLTSCDQIKNLFSSENSDKTVVQTQWQDPEQEEMIRQEPILKPVVKVASKTKLKPAKSTIHYHFIQAGAFKKRTNAENYIENLKKKGHNSNLFIQKNSGNNWYTVRLGAYKNLKKAITESNNFSADQNTEVAIIYKNRVVKVIRPKNSKQTPPISLNANLKSPQVEIKHKALTKPASAKIKTKEVSKKKLYSFQVGGLLKRKNAQRQKKKLNLKGYNAFIAEVRDKLNNEVWLTVQIGHYQTLLEAAKAARQFTYDERLPARARHIYDYHKNF